MNIECITDANLEETGFNYTMSIIQGKYKMFILYALMGFKVVRFNELKKYIKTISYKTLSSTLKARGFLCFDVPFGERNAAQRRLMVFHEGMKLWNKKAGTICL